MSNAVKQRAFQVFDMLSDHEQNLVFELIKSLAPDDITTQEDIASHAAAVEEYFRGETVSHNNINWD